MYQSLVKQYKYINQSMRWLIPSDFPSCFFSFLSTADSKKEEDFYPRTALTKQGLSININRYVHHWSLCYPNVKPTHLQYKPIIMVWLCLVVIGVHALVCIWKNIYLIKIQMINDKALNLYMKISNVYEKLFICLIDISINIFYKHFSSAFLLYVT